MKIIKRLINSLLNLWFGEEVEAYVDTIGLFKTRIRNVDLSIDYSWNCSTYIRNQTIETLFILDGNSKRPFRDQVKSIQGLMSDIDYVISEVENIMVKDPKFSKEDVDSWRNEFYLSWIYPTKTKGGFEVAFNLLDKNDMRYLYLTWKNGKIFDVVVNFK